MAELAGGSDTVADTPKYLEIADEYRSQIADGTLAPGSRLPPEKAESERRGVAIETVRRAYKTLAQDGLIEQIHGRGTFVREWRPVLRNIGKRLSAEVWAAGQSVWSAETAGREYGLDSLRVHRGQPPKDIAEVLGEPDAWIRERRHLVDRRPVMLSVSYYPASIADGSPISEADTGPGGAPARLAERGHAPATHSKRFRARVPTPEERERLALPRVGGVVADFVRTSFDSDGRPVEVTHMVAAGDAYIFQFDFTS